MANALQSVRGMNDILPDMTDAWLMLEKILRDVAMEYGYREIRTPLLEFTQLFTRTIGEETDIVTKEMYTFNDRDGDSLTLRPEGTASCVRAGIEHGLLYNKIQRLFYLGPMFRHDRPQKGRYRQFHQFGVEAYGLLGPDIDAEIILLATRIWHKLKIVPQIMLNINSVGNALSRAKYREHLVEYFKRHVTSLDADSKRRLLTNPLRILDSKNPALQDLIQNAPKITAALDKESQEHFFRLCEILDGLNIPYVVNPNLVRGLDYYCNTVFEWVPQDADTAQSAICGGGHYDTLVLEMGEKSTPAIGFALGMERLLALVQNNLPSSSIKTLYFILLGDKTQVPGLLLAEKLRNSCKWNVIVNCGGGDLAKQLKRADKSGAQIALILGEDELLAKKVSVKHLRDGQAQIQVTWDNIASITASN